jgi:RNase P protein component
MNGPADVVIVARASLLEAGRAEVEADLLRAVQRAGLSAPAAPEGAGS